MTIDKAVFILIVERVSVSFLIRCLPIRFCRSAAGLTACVQ